MLLLGRSPTGSRTAQREHALREQPRGDRRHHI
jgi:hypothetical protein